MPLALVAVLAFATGCTNPEGESEAPVFITVDIEQQPGFINVANAAPVQIDTITLSSALKDPDAADPQGFADTQINSYTVTFTRTDGGTAVPPTQTFGAGILVPSGGDATLSNFPVMYATARLSSRPSTSCCRSTAESTGRPAGMKSTPRST